jgi:hypothetical protein
MNAQPYEISPDMNQMDLGPFMQIPNAQMVD